MFLSIAFAAVGVAGALYSFIVAVVALQNGPLCKVLLIWTTPFTDRWHRGVTFWWHLSNGFKNIHSFIKLLFCSNPSYLTDDSWWGTCTAPKNIVQFHIGLFGTLLAASCLQLILCAIQMINGLFGCICGTCNKGVSWSWTELDLKHWHFPCCCIISD